MAVFQSFFFHTGDSMLEIILITSKPMCPASELLIRRVNEIINLNYENEDIVLHLDVSDNVKVYTPVKVSELAELETSFDIIETILRRRREDIGEFFHEAELWCPELETAMEPLRDAAENLSILMSPVLIIQGEIKSHGSCPSPCVLDKWIGEKLR